MTARRSPPPTSRAPKKKTAAATAKSKVNKAAHAKKIAADKVRWAKEKAAKKKTPAKKKAPARRKPTKQEKRAAQPVRRKPKAPDMSKYVRPLKSLDPTQIAEAKLTIIRVLSMKGNVREATDSAGVHRSQAYEWKHSDEMFSDAWEDSLEEAADRIEQEMWRRAIEGTDYPVIYQGEITDTYKQYSDSLLTLLAKGNRASKYKERTEVSTPPGQPLELKAETKADVICNILSMIHNKPDPT